MLKPLPLLLCVAVLGAALAGCNQPGSVTSTASTQTATTASAANAWFICDATDQPTVLAFMGGPPGTTTQVTEYSKPTGATVGPATTYQLGEGEGAMGSRYTPLQQNGADVGVVRAANPGMLETPGAAYTEVITEVTFHAPGHDDQAVRTFNCRWMPRTRLLAFTGRRSFVINEDADGDLIYTTYDFTTPPSPPIETSDNGRTNRFSVEVRGGEEANSPGGVVYRFANNGYRYVITAETGHAQIQVFQGDRLIQTEDTLATEFGTAAFGQTP